MQKLFYNCDIITLEDTKGECLLTEDGVISFVGDLDEGKRRAAPDCEKIDLCGACLLPAFIDAHSHISQVAQTLTLCALHGSRSLAEIKEKILRFKSERNLSDTDWILAFGYDNNDLESRRHPTAAELDEISVSNPILLTHASGHMGVFNSTALRAIGAENPQDIEGGMIGRTSSGAPDGYMEEKAFFYYSAKLESKEKNDGVRLMREAQKLYASYGIATAQDGLVNENNFALLSECAKKGELFLDVVGYVDVKKCPQIYKENREYQNKYNGRFKLGGYKLFLDGSPQGKTAWLTEPYEGDESRGYPIYSDDEAERLCRIAQEEDVQLLTHVNGDAAADQLLRILAKTKTKRRPVAIHAQVMRRDQIAALKKQNVIPSFFVAHVYHWGDVHLQNLGQERASRISAAREAEDLRIPFTFHQDSPVIPPNMEETLWCAVARKTKSGKTLGKDESIDVLTAIRAVTINAAHQYFEEDKKGSLRKGKLADLVVLDKNPLKIDTDALKNLQVLRTYKEGELIYSKK